MLFVPGEKVLVRLPGSSGYGIRSFTVERVYSVIGDEHASHDGCYYALEGLGSLYSGELLDIVPQPRTFRVYQDVDAINEKDAVNVAYLSSDKWHAAEVN